MPREHVTDCVNLDVPLLTFFYNKFGTKTINWTFEFLYNGSNEKY